MKCPNCGAETGGGRFCSFCGSELSAPAPQNISHVNNSNNTTHQVTNIYYINQPGTDQYPVYGAPDHAAMRFAGPTVSSKSKNWALFLCWFTGGLGGHHFYAGRWGMGLLYLFTGGLVGIGSLIDLFLIIGNKYKDSDGLPISGKTTWAKWIILALLIFSFIIYLSSSGN